MTASSFWDGHFDGPVFVLTGDQDWAPEWALRHMLELAADRAVPVHIFVTNESEALGEARADVTLGIHPSFLEGSTHGSDTESVLDHCQALVSGATSFRTHAFAESTHVIRSLVERGFVADSNLCCFLQPGLVPLVHGAGLLRFPVYLEDDVLLDWGTELLDLAPVLETLFQPGLKVLNFHPALVGINAPSLSYYDASRDVLYSSDSSAGGSRYRGRGIGTVLEELIAAVHDAGHEFSSFPEVVQDAYGWLERSRGGALYRWPDRRR